MWKVNFKHCLSHVGDFIRFNLHPVDSRIIWLCNDQQMTPRLSAAWWLCLVIPIRELIKRKRDQMETKWRRFGYNPFCFRFNQMKWNSNWWWKTMDYPVFVNNYFFRSFVISKEIIRFSFPFGWKVKRQLEGKSHHVPYSRTLNFLDDFQFEANFTRRLSGDKLLRNSEISEHQEVFMIYIKHERQCFIEISKHREESWKYNAQRSTF